MFSAESARPGGEGSALSRVLQFGCTALAGEAGLGTRAGDAGWGRGLWVFLTLSPHRTACLGRRSVPAQRARSSGRARVRRVTWEGSATSPRHRAGLRDFKRSFGLFQPRDENVCAEPSF